MGYKFKPDLIILTRQSMGWMIHLDYAESRIRQLFYRVIKIKEPKSHRFFLLSSLIVLNTDYLLLQEFKMKVITTAFTEDRIYRVALLLISALIRCFLQKLENFISILWIF